MEIIATRSIENTKKNERKPFFICEFIFFLRPLHITESNLNFFASVDKGIHNKTTKYGLPTY